jgi:hypothetical protein
MRTPTVGDLWSDEVAWATSRRPRLLVVTEVTDGRVYGKPISGNGSGKAGVPVEDLSKTWTWQGYWSLEHKTLPRLDPPYTGHLLAHIPKASYAAKLHGTADLVNAIIPSLSPSSVDSYDRDRKSPIGADLSKPVSAAKVRTTWCSPARVAEPSARRTSVAESAGSESANGSRRSRQGSHLFTGTTCGTGAAVMLFRAGLAAPDVQAILGHSSLAVTQMYANTRDDAAQRGAAALSAYFAQSLGQLEGGEGAAKTSSDPDI